MTTTQRPRPPRQAPPTSDPASRGLILVAVAVVLGVILLVKGGGVGFDRDASDVNIGSGGAEEADDLGTTTTTSPPPETSVPPAELKIVALNGAGINGYAAQASQFLSVAGYSSVTAITAQNIVDETVLYFSPGFEVDAMMLAQLLELEPHQVQELEDGPSLARDATEFPPDTAVAIVFAPDVQTLVQQSAGSATGEGGGDSGTAGTGDTTGTDSAGT